MTIYFHYILCSSACITFLYLFYWFFLKNETFFKLNRIYLLAIVVISFVIPAIDFVFTIEFNVNKAESIIATEVFLEDYISNGIDLKTSFNNRLYSIGSFDYISVIYFIISGFLLFRFLGSIYNLFQLIINSNRKKLKSITLVFTGHNIPPLSFLNFIFLNKSKDTLKDFKFVLKHELTHVKQLHSMDLMLMELLIILQWFNPFIWLMRSSIKEIHEFLADNSICLKNENRKNYQLSLLEHAYNSKYFALTNNFCISSIERRIKMMSKTKSKKISMAKIIFIIPIVSLLLLSFSSPEISTSSLNVDDSHHKSELNKTEIEFQLPVTSGHISSRFGMRLHPIYKTMKQHNGIDIEARKGMEVYAAADGVVESAAIHKSAGKNILISHEKNYHTFYSQLDKMLVEQNQNVKKGDVIGLVGSSGMSTGPHLHFEIRKDGKAENPEDYINFSSLNSK